MPQDRQPILDMTPDGGFRSPARPPVSSRILVWAIGIAVVTAAVAFAAFALWIVLTLIPVIVAAAVVIWATLKFRAWQARRSLGRGSQMRWPDLRR